MAKTYKLNPIKNTRLYLKYSLVFFLLPLTFAACKKHSKRITLLYHNYRATAIQIPGYLLKNVSESSAARTLKITRSTGQGKGILGNFVLDEGDVVFEPLIPLSPGLSYTILQNNKPIGSISVPQNMGGQAPVVLAIYPQNDTLPENLLKVYLQFSKPMRTGQALNYIALLDKNNDTMRNVFLNLQPELWDTTGTVLTLWLDPGRIKRGLVLNRKLGNPLKKAQTYQLVVSRSWKDTRGVSLLKNYSKQFVAGPRSGQVPDIGTWQINTPGAGTITPLIINTGRPLDHYLLQESVVVIDNSGTTVNGAVNVSAYDQVWKFTPSAPWKAQRYKLQVNARLEDLTGNNLNRVFDRDITKDKQKNQQYYERGFEPKN